MENHRKANDGEKFAALEKKINFDDMFGCDFSNEPIIESLLFFL